MNQNRTFGDLSDRVAKAVAYYWTTRTSQQKKQEISGKPDQGSRGDVTGGAQMDGFISLFSELITEAGIPEEFVFRKRNSTPLPGSFRATKAWDILVVKDKTLITAIEAKSQAGPSFANNFNNRTEEAMGSALDLWTAYREGAYLKSPPPFLGYLFMLEDCEGSKTPVKVDEPHFKVFPEFIKASYMKRYELFCRKLVRERQYTASAFITSTISDGVEGMYNTPADDLSVEQFAKLLTAHVAAFA